MSKTVAPSILDPVVEPDEVAFLGAVRLLDVRPEEAYRRDRLRGSVRVPIERWIAAAATDGEGFNDTRQWAHRISSLGVGPETRALVYDGGEMTEAARVWFILQYFGARAFIVNGGRPALDGVEIPSPAPLPAAPFHPRPGQGSIGLVDRQHLKGQLGSVAVLDARTDAEFRGDDLRDNRRGGHLPGARLLPHADLLEHGRLLPPGRLRELIGSVGLQPGEGVVTHCQGGGRAALAAIAAQRAGFLDVRVYYRSFGDWAEDESCPVVR